MNESIIAAKNCVIYNSYRSSYFCFPWRRPCDYHTICCNSFRVILCLSQCVSPKIVISSRFLAFNISVMRGVPVGISPPRVGLPDGEKNLKIFRPIFVLTQHTNVTDRRTDRHRMTAITALCIASCGKNVVCFLYTALLVKCVREITYCKR